MSDVPDYDAGLLNNWGGGNVEWWQDYLRTEIGRANEYWRSQLADKDNTHAANVKELEAKLAKAVEALLDSGSSLAAAISLLERGGKKAAPSNKMSEQMIEDYRNSLKRTRTTLEDLKGGDV